MFEIDSRFIPFILLPFVGWGITWWLRRKNEYTTLKKCTLKIGLIAFFLTEIARSFYRPYIYQNHLFDYYISDTIGNSLGTVTIIFMILTISGKGTRDDWKMIVLSTAGLIGYEMINLLTDYPFDYRDVVATLLFGSLSFLLYFHLLKTYQKKTKTK